MNGTEPERDWTLDVRRHLLLESCDHDWDPQVRACIGRATRSDGIASCLQALDTEARDELFAALARASTLAARMATVRTKPASIGCTQVVAAHYGDAKWKGKLASYKAAERKKMIADSRVAMKKACTRDAWSETLRACVVAGGEQTCFEVAQLGLAWGYPAAGSVTSLGIPECDEYGATIQRISTCSSIEPDARAALAKSFDEMRAHMASLSAEEKKRLATSCKAGLAAVQGIAEQAGC
jgi:hypothetical protein